MAETVRRGGESSGGPLKGGRFALGMIIGVLASIFPYILISLLDVELAFGDRVQIFSAAPALMVALVALVISYYALNEQRRSRQAATDPFILAHLAARDDEPQMVVFRISNVGAGAALNVRIDADIDPEELAERKCLVNLREVSHAIRVIPQNQSVSYNLGLGFNLLDGELGALPPFRVTVAYEDIEGNRYASDHEIDVRELALRDASTPSLTSISKSVDRMARSLSKVSKSFDKIGSQLGGTP